MGIRAHEAARLDRGRAVCKFAAGRPTHGQQFQNPHPLVATSLQKATYCTDNTPVAWPALLVMVTALGLHGGTAERPLCTGHSRAGMGPRSKRETEAQEPPHFPGPPPTMGSSTCKSGEKQTTCL